MSATEQPYYTIGQSLPGHLHFILSSWVKTAQSAFRSSGQPQWICRAAHALAWETLQAHGTVVRVAHDPADADHVFGYVVCDDSLIVQQVYVKSAFRGRGIGKALLAAVGCASDARVRVSWSTRHLLATGWPIAIEHGGKSEQYQARDVKGPDA